MGNGASASHVTLDGETVDLAKLRTLLPDLKHQVKTKDAALERCQMDVEECRQAIRERDAEVQRLNAEVHKLKSVLQVKVQAGMPDILATIHEEAVMAGQEARLKKQGVSGESSNTAGPGETRHHDKDFRLVIWNNKRWHAFKT